MRRIGLNLLHALPEIGGGWTYIRNLVRVATTAMPDADVVAFVTNDSEALLPAGGRAEVVRVGLDARWRAARVAYENSLLYGTTRRARVDCLHWFANTVGILTPAASVVTVYDLLVLHAPERFPPVKRAYLTRMLRQTARRADVLAPMSPATGRDLHERLGVPEDRLVVVPNPVDPALRPAPATAVDVLRARYALPAAFWLYVAHAYPHKNHVRLLEAYADARRALGAEAWPLVLRGDRLDTDDSLTEAIGRLGLGAHVHFLPRLGDGEMPALYSAAGAVVFPSLFEGAGLPLVEAIACGCPVLSADIPAARDLLGATATYFTPTDVRGMAAAMVAYARAPGRRAADRARGIEIASRYSDGAVAEQLRTCYEAAAAHSRRPPSSTT